MSDPMTPRPESPTPESTPPGNPPPRKGISPLLWILLLVAVIALAWYFLGGRGDNLTPVEVTPTTQTGDTIEDEVVDEDAADVPADTDTTTPATPAPPRETAATPLNQPRPEYPSEALRAREEGVVLVRATIDTAGNPSDISIVDRSGSRELDRAAREAVGKWTFTPATRDGRKIVSTVEVPVEFKLDEQ